jgi:murein DD-endopeptidase MepM/ murein hydrolase activator NlpD
VPYDVSTDDTHEFAAVVSPRESGRSRLVSALSTRKRYLAAGVATLGLAAAIGVAAGGTGSAHPARTAANAPFAMPGAPDPAWGAGPEAAAAPSTSPSTSPSISPSVSPSTSGPAPTSTPAGSPKPTKTKTPKPKPSGPVTKTGAKGSTKPGTKNAGWVAPMRHYRMTSCYGPRWGSTHQGIDFVVSKGAPVYAAAAGTVEIAGWNSGGYGDMIVIKHSAHVFTLYGHSSKLLVHAGQKVKAGQEIMLEGGTGHVTGPHLHFEVWNAMWNRVNPATFLRAHGVALPRC